METSITAGSKAGHIAVAPYGCHIYVTNLSSRGSSYRPCDCDGVRWASSVGDVWAFASRCDRGRRLTLI
jgi:hypothetical protein